MRGVEKSFPGGSDSKESIFNAEDLGSIPGCGRSLGEGHGNPLQYSCLENPMDRGAWQATVHVVTKESDMTEQLTHRVQRGPICYSSAKVKPEVPSLSG